MTKTMTLLTAAIAALALLVTGCKSDCEIVCDNAQECPQVAYEFTTFDCDDACDFLRDISEAKGCGAAFDDYYACLADYADDVCYVIGDPCAGPRAAYSACQDR